MAYKDPNSEDFTPLDATANYEWARANPAAAQAKFRENQVRVRAALARRRGEQRGGIFYRSNAGGGTQTVDIPGAVDLNDPAAKAALQPAAQAFDQMASEQQAARQPRTQPKQAASGGTPVEATYGVGQMAGMTTADYDRMVRQGLERGLTYNEAKRSADRAYLRAREAVAAAVPGYQPTAEDPGAMRGPELQAAVARGNTAMNAGNQDELRRATAALNAGLPRTQPAATASPAAEPAQMAAGVGDFHTRIANVEGLSPEDNATMRRIHRMTATQQREVSYLKSTLADERDKPGGGNPDRIAEIRAKIAAAEQELDKAVDDYSSPEERAVFDKGRTPGTTHVGATQTTGERGVTERQFAERALSRRMAASDARRATAANVAAVASGDTEPPAPTSTGVYTDVQARRTASDAKAREGRESEYYSAVDDAIKAQAEIVSSEIADLAQESKRQREERQRVAWDESSRRVMDKQDKAAYDALRAKRAEAREQARKMNVIKSLPVPSRLHNGATPRQIASLMIQLPVPPAKGNLISVEEADKFLDVYGEDEAEAAIRAAGWEL